MPKMPKFEDWKAPWEEADEELDAEKAKKLLYNVMVDREKAADARDKAKEEAKGLKTQVDELEAEKNEKDRKGETETQRLERELRAAQKKLDEAGKTESPEVVRLRVALRKGLNEQQARRLSGTTEEELEADADSYLEELGPKDGKKGEADRDGARRTPRVPHNPGDNGDHDDSDIPVDEALKQIPRM